MSRRLLSIPVCAAAALLAWEFIPGTALDRLHFSLTAKASVKSEHFISGKGTYGKPFTLHTLRDTPPDLTGKLPTAIVISDDPEKAFQESPPSPVDFAVILKNLRRMGRDSVAIGMPLTWTDPDVISLTALDQQLDAFPSVITSAPLARSPVPAPVPPAFRRGSVPLSSLQGDTSLLPRVDFIPIPDVLLGNNTSLAGFTTLGLEETGGHPHLLARWDDRAILSFHLLASLQRAGVPPHAITIRLGEWISLGPDGPFIPIDEFGRLAVKPPEMDVEGIPAETLIDAPDDFLTDLSGGPVLVRNGLTTADPAALVYAESLVPVVAMLSDPEGAVTSRTFPRLPLITELLLVASLVSLLYGFGNYPFLRGRLPVAILVGALILLHFILVPISFIWIPTFPLVACAVAAIPFAGSGRSAINRKRPKIRKKADPENPVEKVSTKVEAPLNFPPIPALPKTFSCSMNPSEKADALIEALPYLQAFRSKTILIKMGGSAMEDPELVASVMRDIVFLEVAGMNPIVVHGGGKAISAAMEKSGIEAKFINGLRYTSEEAIGIVSKVLSDEINPGLVRMIRDLGGKAIGIPGTDIFLGEKIKSSDSQGKPVDLGRVGEVVGCQLDNMDTAHKAAIVPVISPLATELATGKPLNINADLAAAALAKELRVAKLVYLSDVPGLLSDPKDPSTLIKSINRAQADALIADGTISGGMIPKVRSAVDALNAGVRKVHFVDGRLPHALLLEIFTDGGIGTEVIR